MPRMIKTKLSSINVSLDNVNSLQEYLLQLALLCISMNTMSNLHEVTIKRGIFNDDEIEKAKTIVYQIQKLMISVNDIISMSCSRTNKEWPDILKEVVDLVPKKRKWAATPKAGKKK